MWLVNISNVQNWCLKLNLGSWFMRCFWKKNYQNVGDEAHISIYDPVSIIHSIAGKRKPDQLINSQNIGGEITFLLKKKQSDPMHEKCVENDHEPLKKSKKLVNLFFSFSDNIKRWFLFTIFLLRKVIVSFHISVFCRHHS